MFPASLIRPTLQKGSALVASYLTLPSEDCPQRSHSLREVLNGLRYVVKTGAPWR